MMDARVWVFVLVRVRTLLMLVKNTIGGECDCTISDRYHQIYSVNNNMLSINMDST